VTREKGSGTGPRGPTSGCTTKRHTQDTALPNTHGRLSFTTFPRWPQSTIPFLLSSSTSSLTEAAHYNCSGGIVKCYYGFLGDMLWHRLGIHIGSENHNFLWSKSNEGDVGRCHNAVIMSRLDICVLDELTKGARESTFLLHDIIISSSRGTNMKPATTECPNPKTFSLWASYVVPATGIAFHFGL